MSVYAAGDNEKGQLGQGHGGRTVDKPVLMRGAPQNVTMLQAAYQSSLLLADGRVSGVGGNLFGELCTGSKHTPVLELAASILPPVMAFAQTAAHGIAVLADSTTRTWGGDLWGQLGNGTTQEGDEHRPLSSDVPVQPEISGIVAVAAGVEHNLALDDQGRGLSWGCDRHGALGNGLTRGDVSRPQRIVLQGLPVDAIAAGTSHSLLLLSDGSVFAFGLGTSGQLGTKAKLLDTPMFTGLSGATAIAAGGDRSLAIIDGKVWQFGEGSPTAPGRVTLPEVAVAVSAGTKHALALLADGRVFGWGGNYYGQLGDSTRIEKPRPVPMLLPEPASYISAGEIHSLIVTA